MVPIPTRTLAVTTMVPIPTTTTMVPIPTTTNTVTGSGRDYADSIVTYFSIVAIMFTLSLLLGAINMLIWYCDKKRTKLQLWQLKHYCRRLDKNGPRKRQHWSTTLSNNARKKRSSVRPKTRKNTGVTNSAMTSMSEHVPF